MSAAAECPYCMDPQPQVLGPLPTSRWFAGARLNAPIPGGGLYRCRRCKLVYRYPVQDAAAYQRLYDNATTSTWTEHATRLDWDLIVDFIHTRLSGNGTVLDFGCYTGGLLGRLRPGLERNGIEINRAAADVAHQLTGARIWPTLDAVSPDLRFDVVVAADVVEHLSDPGALIVRLCGLLRDDGVLVVTTGDADNHWWRCYGANWWYCAFPEHLAFLSEAWLGYLARDRGLSLRQCSVFRYGRLSLGRRLRDTLLMHCYGLFPRTFLQMTEWIGNMRESSRASSIPGNGVSADHLFAVLSRGTRAI